VAGDPTVDRPTASWRRWLVLAAVVVVGVLAFWVGHQRGQLSAGVDAAAFKRERGSLEETVRRLETENEALTAKVAELEMARRLDRDAYGQIERTLGDLQSQLARQGDDLAFYRSIVSPADGVQGLRIQRFEVQPGAEPRQFRIRVTLIQALRQDNVVSGLAQVVVHGMQGDQPAKYSLGELIGKPRAQLPFSFRYFQTLQQEVTLPEDFQAFEAEVEVRSSALRFPMQQSFPWRIAGDGGEMARDADTSEPTTTAR
jgi:hypothetical protein